MKGDMIPVGNPSLHGNEEAYVLECLKSGRVSAGAYVQRFEQDWARYCDVKHGIAVSSGTAALQVAMDALKLGPGDEVILPSFTIISCALAVLRAGAQPILVDCDPETFCMDPEQAARAVGPRTKAIMAVHLYGQPCEMDAIQQLAECHGLAIIEDAAQAHGMEYFSSRRGSWRKCGSLGALSTFSFYANKLVTTGEGGMVLTDSDELAMRCRGLRNLCLGEPRFRHEGAGYNFRLGELPAALGVAQIEQISNVLAAKRRIWAQYDSLLRELDMLQLPSRPTWSRTNGWMYAVLLKPGAGMTAAQLADGLVRRGVETRPFFLGLHEQPALRGLVVSRPGPLPVTERIASQGLYLPTGADLTAAEVEYVATSLAQVLGGQAD